MTLPKLALALILLPAALLAFACGGSGGPAAQSDTAKIPTATLPANLPEPLIVEGTPARPGSSKDTYVVQSGDSLYGIAQKLGTTVDELMSLNNLDSTELAVGQALKIPQASAADATPTESRGEHGGRIDADTRGRHGDAASDHGDAASDQPGTHAKRERPAVHGEVGRQRERYRSSLRHNRRRAGGGQPHDGRRAAQPPGRRRADHPTGDGHDHAGADDASRDRGDGNARRVESHPHETIV